MSDMSYRDCGGLHHYFVATDAATDAGKVLVFLVCTACGDGKKVEFEVGQATSVSHKK
jgi:hypothetical protein